MARNSVCVVEGCDNAPVTGRGYCSPHHQRWRRHGDPLAGGPPRTRWGPDCRVEGCGKSNKTGGKGYCSQHYQRLRFHGSPTAEVRGPRGTCSVDGCDQPHNANGLCHSHNTRRKRHGGPLAGVPLRTKARAGVPLAWLREHSSHEALDCLEWPFSRDAAGYGGVSVDGVDTRAHRVMCEMVNGPAPSPWHEVAHSCGNGHLGCVHPQHLRWATRAENAADKEAHGTLLYGERAPGAKLTETQVREIRESKGMRNAREVGDRYGVSPGAIKAIWQGHNWKRVA